jgi:hypothetical protein
LDSVFGNSAAAVEGELPSVLPDRHNTEVGLATQAGVESHFFTAKVPPLSESRVVDESEIDGLLDLVDVVTGKEDVRDVCLDQLNPGRGMWISRRMQKRPDRRRKLASSHGTSVNAAAFAVKALSVDHLDARACPAHRAIRGEAERLPKVTART